MHTDFEYYLRHDGEDIELVKPHEDATEYVRVVYLDDDAVQLDGAAAYVTGGARFALVHVNGNGSLQSAELFATEAEAIDALKRDFGLWIFDGDRVIREAVSRVCRRIEDEQGGISSAFVEWVSDKFAPHGEYAADVREIVRSLRMASCSAGSFGADTIYTGRILQRLSQFTFEFECVLAHYCELTGDAFRFDPQQGLAGVVTFCVDFLAGEVASEMETSHD